MSHYTDLLARIEHGYYIDPQQLAHAKHDHDQQIEAAAVDQQLADDKAAAEAAFKKHHSKHNATHQPVITKLLTDLKAAHADLVDATTAFTEAQRAYNQIKATRDAKRQELYDYINEHYGHRDYMIDTRVGKSLYDTHIGGMGAVIVEGKVINYDGTARNDGASDDN
ncbi:hypothetical protein CATRI_00110 [Corynebacterium atrinae]|uniref:hypothetical protein n=1 Tax=Corynebacterium atrinae TaxID=1336740 RepID=UPI0025B4AAEE|nr:hypothetical protein [Corynebacterium atrinae]WJY62145.1 hypothetical protein CATRI_00110 [Corynebacterium atrinae]